MSTNKPHDLGERTFVFACDIIRFCRKLSTEPAVTRQISWQLLKEAREARLWLRLILACGLAEERETRALYGEANELVGIFITSVRKLRGPQVFTKALVGVLAVFLVFTFLF